MTPTATSLDQSLPRNTRTHSAFAPGSVLLSENHVTHPFHDAGKEQPEERYRDHPPDDSVNCDPRKVGETRCAIAAEWLAPHRDEDETRKGFENSLRRRKCGCSPQPVANREPAQMD